MGESAFPEARTMVLMGITGNGKSATGNSIIGANVFNSMPSRTSVTTSCQMMRTILDDGKIVSVIDTPGLFDTSVEPEIIRDEFAKCIKMAKNGVHAFLVVISVSTCFSEEEALVIERLKQFFGGEICDYMIVVLTHGDALREVSLDDYLGGVPELLRNFFEMCRYRIVLFDNVTADQLKKSRQQEELLRLVDIVVLKNGGIPYSNELFSGSPDHISAHGMKFNEAYEELQLKKIEARLRETTLRVEKQLADEQLVRKQAEAMALEAQLKSIAEFNRLSEIFRRDLGVLRNIQIESEKTFEIQERLEQGIQVELEIAQRETEMLIKSRRESEQKLNEFNAEQRRLRAESIKSYEDQLLEMESKHREKTLKLEKQLEDEQVARMQAEAAQMKSNYEISKLREDLERAQREASMLRETRRDTQEFLNKMIREKDEENQNKINNCAISEITSAIEHKIESKLRETSLRLENQLAEKSNDEIRKLREDMERAQRCTDDALKKIQLRLDEENQEKNHCSVPEITSTMELQFESIIRERILRFGKRLADEKVAQFLAQEKAQRAEKKSNDEISELREGLERAQKTKIKKTPAI